MELLLSYEWFMYTFFLDRLRQFDYRRFFKIIESYYNILYESFMYSAYYNAFALEVQKHYIHGEKSTWILKSFPTYAVYISSKSRQIVLISGVSLSNKLNLQIIVLNKNFVRESMKFLILENHVKFFTLFFIKK